MRNEEKMSSCVDDFKKKCNILKSTIGKIKTNHFEKKINCSIIILLN